MSTSAERISWLITAHALRRYVERVRRGISYQRALAELQRHLSGAHFVKMLPSGREYWRGPSPRRIRIYVMRNGEQLEVMTVLASFDGLSC